jgi:hypothetical protein
MAVCQCHQYFLVVLLVLARGSAAASQFEVRWRNDCSGR